jgi:uncharacterized protein (DUF488 family)
MPEDATFDLATIGHSNLPLERFITLLKQNGVAAVADVRSVPGSRRYPWFSAKPLARSLESAGIGYLPFGDALGGRPRDATSYCDGVADYEAMAAAPEFIAGLDRLLETAGGRRVCLMCAEREPLDCHRCLLVSRAVARRGHTIGHILVDGSVEPHQVTEQRLLELAGDEADLFAASRETRLADAYRRRSRAVAYRAKT